MEVFAVALFLLVLIVAGIFFFGPRPTLDPTVPKTRVPVNASAAELEKWLVAHEKDVDSIIDGAEATILWANEPGITDLCFLYIHGFSASRQETAPLTDQMAAQFNANIVYTRLAGHGLDRGAMQASAEQWLQSVVDSWEIASRIGKRVVLVATSTGAPLAIWLNEHLAQKGKVHSIIFVSPNFKIRNPFSFVLTWPWAQSWLPLMVGREHSWEPESELAGRYWTNRYSVQAMIEMQKIVDWAVKLTPTTQNIPLATLYMVDDPTIDHEAAIDFHHAWDADYKKLHTVDVDAENPQHVFVGDITAPHRVDSTVKVCVDFLQAANSG